MTLVAAEARGDNERAPAAKLSDVKGYVVTSITRRSGGSNNFVPTFPNAWSSYVEVQATVQPSSSRGGAGVPLGRVALEARYRGEPWTANVWAVGAMAGGSCRYLPATAEAGQPQAEALPDGATISLLRANDADPGTLTVAGRSVAVCLLFTPPKQAVGPVAMTFDGRRFPLGDVLKPQQESTSAGFDLTATVRAHGPKIALGLGSAAALVAMVWLGWRRFMARRPYVLASSASPGGGAAPMSEGARVEPAPIEAPSEAPSALQVSARHCRLAFAPVAAHAGAGARDFDAAQRALQVNSDLAAEQLLARAIETGLDPTFACGAWAFRGRAALRLGRGEDAVRCFLTALEGERVTQQAAHLASSHLAVIYRELGWRSDARCMEQLAAVSGSSEIVSDKRFVESVRRGLRANRPPQGRSWWGRITRT